MKHVVVIGHSLAAYTAVRSLLDRDPSLGITLISCDGQLPYDRTLLAGLIDHSVKESGLWCAPQDTYAAARVEVILDKEISRVNFNRKRIFLADKVQVEFDGLIITDAPQVQWPQLKGIRRQGVFHLARLGAVRDLVRYLAFTETVVLEPSGFSGIKGALALKSIGKDVVVVHDGDTLLPGLLNAARAQALAAALQKRGIRVMAGGVEDVIGELEVKAVRLRSGKVVACDMLVLERVTPDLRFLSETGLALDERIPVDVFMRSNIPAVLALDAVARIGQPLFKGEYWLAARTGCLQAKVAVEGLLGGGLALTLDDLAQEDILDAFFDPRELVPVLSEAAA